MLVNLEATTVFQAVYSSVYTRANEHVLQMKQRLIAVWSVLQHTVVDKAIDEQKEVFTSLQMDNNLRICYNV